MRHTKSTLCIFLLVFSVLLLGADDHAESDGLVDVTIATLRGPTGVGMAPALAEQPILGQRTRIAVEVVPEPGVMVARLASGEAQVGMLPSNVVAQLHGRGVPVQIAAVTLWGVLYVVGTDTAIDEWTDLRGREIHSIARGANPDIILRHLLDRNGIDPDDELTIEYGYGHVELAQLVAAGEVSLAMLPEPFVTQVLSRRDDLSVLLDVQSEWRRFYGAAYPQTAVVVRRDFADDHPEAIAEALDVVESGWDRILTSPLDDTLAPAWSALGISPAIVEAALGRFNARYLASSDAQEELDAFFRILATFDPRAVGGSVPDESIYYLAR